MLIPPVQRASRQPCDENDDETSASHDGKMMGGMMGDVGGGAGQNPFAEMMRQMQDMQNQQGGHRDSTLLMVKPVK